ncbi:PAS domain-containing sensor histidine kinase [Trichlorobacter ammonificans]|uniref:histidine kinase n=1 Tax=Trichlorobacter ammonificans TaxID=2916410 RepID=A0ABM9D9D6_9BACT|nr:PAS domain-containing sensor histidine kinase [Trichlorobacter ammonificans]CAH2031833.1 putative Histidine kinase [Trichlorobacter ammonificans]
MDIKTVILTLAIGSFVFGTILILFQYGKEPSQRIPFWVTAKFMQGGGSLLLYARDATPEFIGVLVANCLLLSGCAYEGWAIVHITGRRVSRFLHVSTAAATMAACVVMLFLEPSKSIAVSFSLHTLFYALPGWALLKHGGEASLLRRGLGWSFCLLALIFGVRAVWALVEPAQSHLFFGVMIHQVMLPAVYCMMLISGFSMLLLAKETSDRALRTTLREQKAILETLPTGLAILRERIIERCNPALEAIFGFAPGTMAGTSTACLYENAKASEQYGRIMYEAIVNRGSFAGEVAVMRQNGERFWAWVQGTSIFPERAQSYAVFSVTDISQQKAQQQLLQQQNQELEKAGQARSRFLKTVAHEFRTPLGLLASSTDILDRYWERLNTAERGEQNSRIRSAARQLSELTTAIISHNQAEGGSYEPVLQQVDLTAFCRTVAGEAETVWSNGHTLHLAIGDDCGSAVLDETLLRRVLQNLLSNAFRYTPPEGFIALRARRIEGQLVLEVVDSGIGISEDDQQHIFEAYYRGSNTGLRRGLGLGLAIVREALELLRGTITITSAPGAGTTMLVTLPLAEMET